MSAVREVVWGHIGLLVTGFSGWSAFFIGRALLTGPFPSWDNLAFSYFMYFGAILVFLHGLFFLSNSYAKRSFGRTLSVRIPKYLEYAYALILSLGMFQILFVGNEFSDYVKAVVGDDRYITSDIVEVANGNLKKECAKRSPYFTAEYCSRLAEIVASKDPRTFLIENIVTDEAFLDHEIGQRFITSIHGTAVISVKSRIAELSRALEIASGPPYTDFSNKHSGSLIWLTMLMLPIGIALRILKTSLELFGNLQ